MAQNLSRNDVIKAFELSYDFQSARTVLKDILTSNKLDPNLGSFEGKQVSLLEEHLQADLPRSERALSYLDRLKGGDGAKKDAKPAASPATPPPTPQAAKKDDKSDKRDDKSDKKDDKSDKKDDKSDKKDDKSGKKDDRSDKKDDKSGKKDDKSDKKDDKSDKKKK